MNADVTPLSIASARLAFERSQPRVESIDFDAETVTYRSTPAEVILPIPTGSGAIIEHDGSTELLSAPDPVGLAGGDGSEGQGTDPGPNEHGWHRSMSARRRFQQRHDAVENMRCATRPWRGWCPRSRTPPPSSSRALARYASASGITARARRAAIPASARCGRGASPPPTAAHG